MTAGKKSLSKNPVGQQQYMVVGRFVPNIKYGEAAPMCKVYRMKLFAKNIVCARSRFWYFMGRLCRVKKANGQIISVNEVRERPPPLAPSCGARRCTTRRMCCRRAVPQRGSWCCLVAGRWSCVLPPPTARTVGLCRGAVFDSALSRRGLGDAAPASEGVACGLRTATLAAPRLLSCWLPAPWTGPLALSPWRHRCLVAARPTAPSPPPRLRSTRRSRCG